MNAFTLHLPEGRGLSRWTLAGVTILMAHAAIVAAVVSWYARRPVEPNIPPAIAVTSCAGRKQFARDSEPGHRSRADHATGRGGA